jgi:hypothetical protein
VLNGSGVWSGSAQLPSGVVSGSAQVSFNGIADKPSLVSGSSQISYPSLSNIPGGIVSGSVQIDLTATTNYSSGILTRLNAVGVFSGSAQVTGISNSQLTNSSFHVGTTSISLGRSSAAQTLTGVSIDGNSATVGGFTPSQTSGTANRVVVADANGYIVNNYFNASGGGAERNASGMGYFAGHNSSDYYYRSYTAAAAAALLSGQSMNISGTATNITAYTINQNVGSSNSPTFSGLDLTGRLYLNAGSYEGSILFGSSDVWRCGIRQHDDADAELRIWAKNANGMIFLATGYNGEPSDISRPTDGLVVGPSNNVGIGNFSAGDPSYKLHVKGTAGIENNLTVGGTLTENSSIRYKKDIETISYGLDKVLKMRGVTYLKKENDIKEVGVIAEEIAEIFPELVNYDTEGRPDSVSYGRITGLLIEAIKDLKKEINELKNNG